VVEKYIRAVITFNDMCDRIDKPYERGYALESLKILNS